MTRGERRRRRFSMEFKKQQVELIESGQVTVAEVSSLYEVAKVNVYKWLKTFGNKKLYTTTLVTDGSEYKRVQQLEKEVEKLTKIIGEQQVELLYNKQLIAIAEKKLGDDFKKKS